MQREMFNFVSVELANVNSKLESHQRKKKNPILITKDVRASAHAWA